MARATLPLSLRQTCQIFPLLQFELPGKLPLRIWEDIGTAESGRSTENVETVADADALRDALVNKGWVLDSDLKYTVVDGAKHNEKAWAARFPDILKYLYPPVPATP